MSFQPSLDFQAASEAAEDGQALIVDVDGYEGPLHALLALARTQRVDLLKISISALADQYLAFVREARRVRFSLAADYLVMAAWLAYLKSRLLLPKPEKIAPDEAPAEEVAARLAFRLAKLDAMRQASEALKVLPQLGRDVFTRGDPDAIKVVASQTFEGDLYALMTAYMTQRKRDAERRYTPHVPKSYPLEEARDRLRGMLPELERWTPLSGVAPRDET
ncbi:MAG: segregation/condensation protein A, partial [Caulobacterales bacterium]|nr:segregation/condensation protein A [Caulobacterales bacterium]